MQVDNATWRFTTDNGVSITIELNADSTLAITSTYAMKDGKSDAFEGFVTAIDQPFADTVTAYISKQLMGLWLFGMSDEHYDKLFADGAFPECLPHRRDNVYYEFYKKEQEAKENSQ